MVYNTVLTAEKQGPQIVGAQIAGVYFTKEKSKPESHKCFIFRDTVNPRNLRPHNLRTPLLCG